MNENKTITIKTSKGEKSYIIRKFSAFDGLFIVAKFKPDSLFLAKDEEYDIIIQSIHKAFSYVSVAINNGSDIRLQTREQIEAYIPDWQAILKVMDEIISYNAYPLDQELP